ncbi:Dynamin-like protein ARC5 [Camellia lanceoleosa]|uniref:Dynamin-like protein ARC5 n=1 Tax=Camellia lanceoleosa TaxID=1840588 RepID=A0ACC0ILK6_9ERIC|nr:Dynamin-like protein ARC5 [Camellia lanceoleosa]
MVFGEGDEKAIAGGEKCYKGGDDRKKGDGASIGKWSPNGADEERGRLYEAYNELHGLAQEFETPFEAPAVLVVGHQTDRKSALVAALMGFQFNLVGGGTKTRRPITLHMKYNPDSHSLLCHLLSDSEPFLPQQKSLQEIQAYIEAENMRLEHEPCQFSAKEIIIRVEYKYCPNLTIIDTPGLIAPAPGRKNRSLQIDPELSRTVIVSTKLDTKIPQFARASDVEVFLSPPASTLDGFMLGDSPFFTSVPSGRVGPGHESVYQSNEEFKQAISLREMEDVASLEEKLGRPLSKQERSRIGVSSLRLFLEELLQKRYMDSVPLIIPLLEKEYRSTTRKLNEINEELSTFDEVKLKEKGRAFHDLLLTKLSLLLKGTVVAPPDKFGEALQDERINGGAFIGTDGLQFPHKLIPNAGMRLYGGAQYHRAMAEFRFVVGGIKCPPITREEIVNACGVEDIHDGTNYSRTACVIAVAKAHDTFEPFLHQLGFRLLHILKRLLPISVYLLQKEGEVLSGHDVFLRRVASAFNNFAESTERSCREKCLEDLMSTTRYVTWSLHNKNRAGLRHFLDSFGGTEQSTTGGNSASPGLSHESSFGSMANDKHDTKQRIKVQLLSSDAGCRQVACTSSEDLESAFEDDMDNVFDITNLRHSLGQQKRETEIELKRY